MTTVRLASLRFLSSCLCVTRVRQMSCFQYPCLIREVEGSLTPHSNRRDLLSHRTLEGMRQQRRLFSKKRHSGKKDKDDDDSDREDEEEYEEKDDTVGTGFSDGFIACNALRVDAVAKTATNMARHLMEEAFMEGRLRLNGHKVSRKTEWVNEGDCLDLIKGRNKDNEDLLDVFRVEIKSIPDMPETGKIRIKVRRFKHLPIPNYTEDPWMGTAVTEEQ